MSVIKFIAQVLLVLGLAAGVFVVAPLDFYIAVGALTALLTIGLMFSVELEHAKVTLDQAMFMLVLGLLFGALWPSLPIIYVWGAVLRRNSLLSRPKVDDSRSSSFRNSNRKDL